MQAYQQQLLLNSIKAINLLCQHQRYYVIKQNVRFHSALRLEEAYKKFKAKCQCE